MTVKTKEKQAVAPKPSRYHEATGGRKTSLARVRLSKDAKGITVNGLEYRLYFRLPKHQEEVRAPFATVDVADMGVTVMVRGGGIHSQAHAVRHAIAKALVQINPDHKKRLRRAGFITRDARIVERKKYGLKKARRGPQWQKR